MAVPEVILPPRLLKLLFGSKLQHDLAHLKKFVW
jgi:hypothetical protein